MQCYATFNTRIGKLYNLPEKHKNSLFLKSLIGRTSHD